MTDDPRLGIGGNHPPKPHFELRHSHISCDWTYPKRGAPRHRWCGYWRIVRDGVVLDSFLTKARAERKLAELRRMEDIDA